MGGCISSKPLTNGFKNGKNTKKEPIIQPTNNQNIKDSHDKKYLDIQPQNNINHENGIGQMDQSDLDQQIKEFLYKNQFLSQNINTYNYQLKQIIDFQSKLSAQFLQMKLKTQSVQKQLNQKRSLLTTERNYFQRTIFQIKSKKQTLLKQLQQEKKKQENMNNQRQIRMKEADQNFSYKRNYLQNNYNELVYKKNQLQNLISKLQLMLQQKTKEIIILNQLIKQKDIQLQNLDKKFQNVKDNRNKLYLLKKQEEYLSKYISKINQKIQKQQQQIARISNQLNSIKRTHKQIQNQINAQDKLFQQMKNQRQKEIQKENNQLNDIQRQLNDLRNDNINKNYQMENALRQNDRNFDYKMSDLQRSFQAVLRQKIFLDNRTEEMKKEIDEKDFQISGIKYEVQLRDILLKEKVQMPNQNQNQNQDIQIINPNSNPNSEFPPKIYRVGNYYFNITQKPLGQGTFGIVYIGHQINHPLQQVAIKVIKTPFSKLSSQQQENILQQISLQKNLDVACAVQVKNYGIVQFITEQISEIQDNGEKLKIAEYLVEQKMCIVMQLLKDGCLKDILPEIKKVIKEDPLQGQKLVLKNMFKIVKAYKGVYANNIAHKDLKPENILVKKIQNDWIFKIADFGISKHHVQNQKKLQEAKGTQAYSSPQQSKGQPHTNKCDVYAFGGISFYLLIGQSPMQMDCVDYFSKATDQKETKKVLKKFSPQIIDFILNCLQQKQEKRYSWQNIFNHSIFQSVQTLAQQAVWKHNMAMVYEGKKSYQNSLKFYKESLDLIQKMHGKDTLLSTSTLNNIGIVYIKQGDLKNALKYLQKCLSLEQKFIGKESLQAASTLNNIALVNEDLGQFDKSLKQLDQCLKIQEKIKGKGHIQTASALNSMGEIYLEIGDLKNALLFSQQSLKIKQKGDGVGSFSTSSTLNNLGMIYTQKGQYQNALKCLNDSLQIKQKVKGKGSIETASTLNNIGQVFIYKKDYNLALKYLNEALQIKRYFRGEQAIETASTINNIGQVYYFQKNFEAALKSFKSCVQIVQTTKGKDAIQLASILMNLSFTCEFLKNEQQSNKYYKESIRLCEKYPHCKRKIMNRIKISPYQLSRSDQFLKYSNRK